MKTHIGIFTAHPLNTQPSTTAHTDLPMSTWVHRPTNTHTHLPADRQTYNSKAFGPCAPLSVLAGLPQAATCYFPPCGETRDVMGIWCQFSQKPSSASADSWGKEAPAEAIPWPSGQPAWKWADFSRDAGPPTAAGVCWKRASCPPVCTCLGHWTPGQPLWISLALRAGWEARGNKLAEISRASYLPKPACSHKSQNRVPGRAMNSEMQRQLQRKIVERNRPKSCLPSPQVSGGFLEWAQALWSHSSQYHPLVSK